MKMQHSFSIPRETLMPKAAGLAGSGSAKHPLGLHSTDSC